MKGWKLAAIFLFGAAFDGCGGSHDDPSPPPPLSILANGGGAFTQTTISTGGNGGAITAASSGAMKLFNSGNHPTRPTAPTPPATGTELTNAMITAGTPIVGNVLVSSSLQIAAGVNPAVITTNTGDVVIRGSLLGERSAGATTVGITVNAPAGTIYVIGSIRTKGTPGTPDNPNGGPISLTAQRIVVLGTLDSSGEALPAGTGGNGGAISMDTTGGGGTSLFLLGGAVNAAGGTGTQGGKGGNVSAMAGALLAVFAPIRADGGVASFLAGSPIGGDGGSVNLRGNAGADVDASITMTGGNASGFVSGATGGKGGAFTAGSAAPYRLFGLISTAGGIATANTGGIQGGDAGSVQIGVGTPVTTLELGSGPCNSSGGYGDTIAGKGGSMDFASLDGDITAGGSLNSRGGPSRSAAGNGGNLSIKTDADPSGNTVNHILTIIGLLDARSGEATGQFGGVSTGGTVSLQCGGNMTVSNNIYASSRDRGGFGGNVTLQVAAANTAPSGSITMTGNLLTEGQDNGGGGAVLLDARAGISYTGTLSTAGLGDESNGGPITLQSASGTIDVTGILRSFAGSMTSLPIPTAGDILIQTPGTITISAMMDASGSFGTTPNSNQAGGPGGTITVTSTASGGTVTLLPGTEIRSDGGQSYPSGGNTTPAGGPGGRLLISTVDQPVSISAKISLKGGDNLTGDGGLGGQVVVDSDSDGNGTGGNITLTAGSVIDVSGGQGFSQGSARNNGGVAPANSNTANLAVIFDAGGSLTASPDGGNEGVVRNLGTITAKGFSVLGRGGDLWFDGKKPGGADLTGADSGTTVLTGPAGSGAFFPN